jgi:ribosomal protein S18 acetylase RimI-like enzyme
MAPGNSLSVKKKNKAWLMENVLSFIMREFCFPQDYPAVCALWQHAGPGIQLRRSDQPEEIAKKLLRDPELFLVTENKTEIIGTVIGGFDGRRGMMYHLAVAPAYRRQGVGAALMGELERRLRAKGCIRYYCLVTKDNMPAVQFYEGHGWQRMDLYALAKDL